MTDEQFRLIARILDDLCTNQARYLIKRHPSLGIASGRCTSCGALARIDASGASTYYEHGPTCVLTLNGLLQQSLQREQEEANNL